LVFLALLVLELFTMYATDRRTDGRTKATLNAPYPTGGGIIILRRDRDISKACHASNMMQDLVEATHIAITKAV